MIFDDISHQLLSILGIYMCWMLDNNSVIRKSDFANHGIHVYYIDRNNWKCKQWIPFQQIAIKYNIIFIKASTVCIPAQQQTICKYLCTFTLALLASTKLNL